MEKQEQVKLIEMTNTVDDLNAGLKAYSTVLTSLSIASEYIEIDKYSLAEISDQLYNLHLKAETLLKDLQELKK